MQYYDIIIKDIDIDEETLEALYAHVTYGDYHHCLVTANQLLLLESLSIKFSHPSSEDGEATHKEDVPIEKGGGRHWRHTFGANTMRDKLLEDAQGESEE